MRRDTPNLKYISTFPNLNDRAARFRYLRETHDFEGRVFRSEITEPPSESLRFEFWMAALDQPMYFTLPLSDCRYIIHGDIYEDLLRIPPVRRLMRIKQLGSVTLADFDLVSATHTRYAHSLGTAILMEAALDGLEYDQDTINLGITAAMVHDIAIPPYSDQGKLGSGGIMDEETNITRILEDPSFQPFFSKYNISPKDVLAVVDGSYPVLGPLMNSVGVDLDKVSYVGLDYNVIAGPCRMWFGDQVGDPGLWEIRNRASPTACNVYEKIQVIDDDIVFTDANTVADFLLLRALLFRHVYKHPSHTAKEMYLKRELKRLWDSDVVSVETLLSMTDEDFDALIDRHTDPDFARRFFSMSGSFETVTTVPGNDIEAVRRSYPEPDFIVEQQYRFNPAVDTRVFGSHGETRWLRDVLPQEVKEMELLADSCNFVGVYRKKDM